MISHWLTGHAYTIQKFVLTGVRHPSQCLETQPRGREHQHAPPCIQPRPALHQFPRGQLARLILPITHLARTLIRRPFTRLLAVHQLVVRAGHGDQCPRHDAHGGDGGANERLGAIGRLGVVQAARVAEGAGGREEREDWDAGFAALVQRTPLCEDGRRRRRRQQ